MLAVAGIFMLVFLVPDTGLPQYKINIAVEAAKSLFQLIVVVLIGGTVTALIKAFETSNKENKESEEEKRRLIRLEDEKLHEEAKFRSAIRSDYLKRVGTSYRVAKAVSRDLRAAGLTNKFNLSPTILSEYQVTFYRESMTQINEAQLELEALKIEAMSLPDLVELPNLDNLLRSMEQYLGKILKEYQEVNPKLEHNRDSVSFEKMKRLNEFTGSASEGGSEGFEDCLATPHDKIIQLVANRT